MLTFKRDRKDAKFLSCAIAAKADLLITGDKDFSEAQTLIETKIISASHANFTVFNIKGNHYRLITYIDYEYQLLFIRNTKLHNTLF
jgi:putative NIF3 family GTP cyclohydrolase 1 type 2